MSKITRRNFLKVSGVAAAAAALTACGGSSSTASSAASGAASSEAASTAAKLDKIKVAVPNDTTNEARALTLLEKNGFFKLKADAGLTATKNDIEENPLNVNVDEVEAAQVPNVLQDEDYAVINSNYAISAGLDPMTDALAMEDGTSAYVNVLVCKEGNEEEPKIKALVAALQSQQWREIGFIECPVPLRILLQTGDRTGQIIAVVLMGKPQRQLWLHHRNLAGIISENIADIPPALAIANRTLGHFIRFKAVTAIRPQQRKGQNHHHVL